MRLVRSARSSARRGCSQRRQTSTIVAEVSELSAPAALLTAAAKIAAIIRPSRGLGTSRNR